MKSCELICVNKSHEPIPLPDGQPVMVGRSPATKIKDARCSRNQVQLTADWKKQEVDVKQLGSNSCMVDDTKVNKGESVKFKANSTLCLLNTEYPHTLKFHFHENNKPQIKMKQDVNLLRKRPLEDIKSPAAGDAKKPKLASDISGTKPEPSPVSKVPSKITKLLQSKLDSIKQSKLDNKNVNENSKDILIHIKKSQKDHTSKANDKSTDNKKQVSIDAFTGNALNQKKKVIDQAVSSTVVKNIEETKKENNVNNGDKKKCDVLHSSKKEEKEEEVKKLSKADKEDSEAHLKNIAEKLEKLKDKKKDSPPSKPDASPPIPLPAGESPPVPNKPKVEFKFFTKKSAAVSKESNANWKQVDKLHIYTSTGVQGREKIAGFDIDGTIITTQSGKVFPTHPGDWKLHYVEIPKKIKELYANGYKIVLFTNQMGVSRGKVKIDDLKEKFTNIVARLNVPVQVLVATGSGMYRKPCTGMWDYLKTEGNDDVKINTSESFYVGDAAGRPDKWNSGKKKDFSCSDRLFSINIGMIFFTPEEYFMKKPTARFSLPNFDPRSLSSDDPLTTPPGGKIVSKSQEVIVLSGYPASGKSFFANKYLVSKGYIHVNRDTVGTWQKCVSLCTKSLESGKSVVIDNTNPDKISRERYIECAKKAGVPIRCFAFNVTFEQAKHNERFRESTDKSHKAINDLVMNSFKSKLVSPMLTEGFSEILRVNFVPKFENPDHGKLYRLFLMEK